MELKDTLLLPKTEFSMRGNLGNKEPEIIAKWEELKIYEKGLKLNEKNKSFVLHDGPPYANGPIHIGHALNKILKDFVVRYKTLKGFYARYIPGWDTHGLPIESALSKQGITYKTMLVSDYRKLCEKYANKQIDAQKEQFKRIGILGEWDKPYITLQPEFEEAQLLVFAKMVERGLIYKGLRPVYWSPSSESALAEAEIIYEEVTSPSITVQVPVVEGKFKGQKLVFWTTTPWTLPANLAISVNPNYDYVSVETDKDILIMAKDLHEKVMNELNITNYQVIDTYKGEVLEYSKYVHPLYDEKILPVILGEHVTVVDGTGLVHTAPGHGEEDFIVGKEYNLDVLVPIDDAGYYTADTPNYAGMFYMKANPLITEQLENKGLLLKLDFIKHSYPHDWRTRKPIMFKATPQWFASIEPIKEEILAEIKKVEWVQKWGELRISNMIKDRNDWCISRQRVWGVPIPVFYAEDESVILDADIIRHIAKIFGKEGSNAWFIRDAKDLLPKGYTHPGSPNGIFKKEMDIMDVWFDSGTSYTVLNRNGIDFPADLYLEGSDQYRGWFNSSLTTSVAVNGKSPYKAVISHGFVLDEKNRIMSKSLGNVIDPLKIMKENGADILRLWVSTVDYASDVKLGQTTIKLATETYRKLRNTFRFMLANLFDFSPKENLVPYEKLINTDKMMLVKLQELKEKVFNAYDNYRFDVVNRLITNYIINALSAYYLDYAKDVLYVDAQDSAKRRGMQTVIYHHLNELLLMLNPIIPHTTSEVYWHLSYATKEDVYLERFTDVEHYKEKELLEDFDKFLELRNDVLLKLEELRKEHVIGKSLEAGLNLGLPKDLMESIKKLEVDLPLILMVAEVNVKESETLEVEAYEAEGHKCERCWNIVKKVNLISVCERCEEVLKEMKYEDTSS